MENSKRIMFLCKNLNYFSNLGKSGKLFFYIFFYIVIALGLLCWKTKFLLEVIRLVKKSYFTFWSYKCRCIETILLL